MTRQREVFDGGTTSINVVRLVQVAVGRMIVIRLYEELRPPSRTP